MQLLLVLTCYYYYYYYYYIFFNVVFDEHCRLHLCMNVAIYKVIIFIMIVIMIVMIYRWKTSNYSNSDMT